MTRWCVREKACAVHQQRGQAVAPDRLAQAALLVEQIGPRHGQRIVRRRGTFAEVRHRRALVLQQLLGHRPAAVQWRPPGCAAGTRTSSKKTSQKLDLPLISSIGLTVTPGARHVDQQEADAFLLACRGSVRTSAYIQSDWSP